MGYDHLVFPEGSRFLVTGGAGFIGSNLCEALLRLGHPVRCLDDFSTGKRENVAGFLSNPLFELQEGDIRSLDDCLRACEKIGFVSHQAAWGSVPRSVELPLLYEEINIRGTLNMLEAARRQGAGRFVYASSSSVYGDDQRLPKVEGQEGKPLSPYALTKRADEEYGRLYWTLYGLPTVGLRYFNVFGRRQDPDGPYAAVIPKFVRQLLKGERPVIHGDGLQSRDFTYVENVVEANLKAFLAPSEAFGEALNIACGGRETLLDVHRALTEMLGIAAEPAFAPTRKGDIRHSNADISKAVKLIGYDPEYGFRQGLAASIAWYRENL